MTRENKIGFLIKHCDQEMKKSIDSRFGIFDLTSSQVHTLIFIIRSYRYERSIKQRDIEQFLEISNPTVTGILNRLECKGLVQRVASSEDARVKFIIPSAKALEMDKEIKTVFKENEDAALKGFSEQEEENLRDYLNRIINNLR